MTRSTPGQRSYGRGWRCDRRRCAGNHFERARARVADGGAPRRRERWPEPEECAPPKAAAPTRAPVPCTADFSDVTLTGKRPSRRCLENARCDPRSVDHDPTSTRIIASRACERRGATGRPSTHRIRQDCPTEHLHLRHRPSVGPRRAGPQPSIQARCRWSPPRRFSSSCRRSRLTTRRAADAEAA